MMTYETPNTEVHSKVFVDEALGDTIVDVISPISRKKTRARKRAPPLLSPFTTEQRLKKRKIVVCFDALQLIDPSQTVVLM